MILKISIIGAGIAGIASAIRLAKLGHQVTIFEQNSHPGGKLSRLESSGYRFDVSPSCFTMPKLIDELFELTGKNPRDYFNYQQLDIVTQYFWEDGMTLNAHADKNKFASEVERKFSVNTSTMHKAFNRNKRKFDLVYDFFLDRSLHKTSTYFSKSAVKAFLNLGRLELFRSMHNSNVRAYEHPKLVQVFNRFATYNGASPYKASARLNILSHVELGMGTYFPYGGLYAITDSLYQLAREVGITFEFNAPVEEILLENKRVKGVIADKKTVECDAVVSNMDVYYTYRKLLPNQKHPEEKLNQTKSSSALIFYWGINRTFPKLGLHNIFFSDDSRMEFNSIFNKKNVYFDPTIYLYISKKLNPEDAPEGCENWAVRINVPNNSGQDWNGIIRRSRENVVTKLSRMLKTNLRSAIVSEKILEPRIIEKQTSSYLGALHGTSSNSKLSIFSRHPNFSKSIKGLYFCGASVHPGGSLPFCLLSAKIVADLIGESR